MRMIVVPSDSTMIKDGIRLVFAFAFPVGLHAVQWYGAEGTVETDDGNQTETTDFSDVEPFSTAFDNEVLRLAQVAALPMTPAQIAENIKAGARRDLPAIDAASIRSIREWILSQPLPPAQLVAHNAAAILARSKL